MEEEIEFFFKNENFRKIKKEEEKKHVLFDFSETLPIEKNEVYEFEQKKNKSFFLKTLGDSCNEGKKFRIRKEEMKMRYEDIDLKQKSIRKYTTNSPELKEQKESKKKTRRESIDRFENINVKLPALHIPMKKNPLITSLNEDFHSKSLSPLKLRPGKMDKSHDNYSKMYLPSNFIFIRNFLRFC